MSTVIHFSPDLSVWILHNLNQGCAPTALIQEMQAQQMTAQAAHAIVAAFVTARQSGQPPPVDSVVIEDAQQAPQPGRQSAQASEPDYVYEAPIFHSGSTLHTTDRSVRIAARAARPMLAVLEGLLSADECEELITLARPRLTRSTVVDPPTGLNVVTGQRSSLGMFFRLQENGLIARLDKRISEAMNLPIENGEGLQILHYPTGAGSAPHFDFLIPSNAANQNSIARSGQRVSTMVTYLNDVASGGETIFPQAGWSVSPQRGNAVYFEYCNSRNQVDHGSLHASNPVERGEKWVATKWMRQRRFVSADGV
ncbi:2OG-Fe(II) oxygenase [Glaciimonas immobilis]|uniref:Prolyl 4-hydroxylase n=1 Tax=Glaciimonas immobilis TaxID=728004 RepID=A0A840RP43_9BURK|nr:2OG-Fe(II) oxygenase [Glaciimonas immobilis]KAF3999246.1 2-oxoglutarate-dependent dioxygenase [Glaciimonas immobilis]MBB5198708.1 prolyl 4-hydroxylase [Glaciimonas immobilis]